MQVYDVVKDALDGYIVEFIVEPKIINRQKWIEPPTWCCGFKIK